ncbi:BadF/BadG/BcrA/BcrD ATPase family protein [Abyssisolibacter fermentans]|uniref:BadF/BadG/BcrA/BcrD ATPase family protein n=1 Tax=Abyssisolibacter fermentans TaxID=1766203 RepID=UPI00082C9338|nr:BadF/BadG/BcrA/BcrD ATPase family protein [Abyssisolibacter fermentans]
MNFVIGIEGGGTKSTIAIADLNGKFIDKTITGTTNINSSSLETVSENIHLAVNALLERNNLNKENCSSFCIGSAGIDSKADKQRMMQLIKSLGIEGLIAVTNDAEISLKAGIEKGEGILIIAGTGSIAYGEDTVGNCYRAGGWDYLIGDEGSGYWIATQAINKALKSWDEKGEKSKLLCMLMDEISIQDVEEFINYIYKVPFNKKIIAGLSVVVDRAYQEGDSTSKAILYQASKELVFLTQTILKRMKYKGQEITLIAHGSILVNNKFVYDKFKTEISKIYPNIKVIKLRQGAWYGAVKLALFK